MSILLGVGAHPKTCLDTIKDEKITHILQFLSNKGKNIFGNETPPEGVTIEVVKQEVISDPTRNEAWGKKEINKMIEYATAVSERLKKGEVVMIVCNAGMNRSPTCAYIAARLTWKEKIEMRKPEDLALQEFVNIFDKEDSSMRHMMLAKVCADGISGASRPKRARNN
jgi:predicted protein tyrosine phosphatase